MNFPPWVERKPRAERASARLKYMLNQAGLMKFGTPSIRAISRRTTYDHSAFSLAIRRGYFTEAMADAVVKVLTDTEVTREALIDPLAAVFADENVQ